MKSTMSAHKNSVASLMQRALERQADISRSRFKLEPNQIHQILLKREKHAVSYNELIKILGDWPLSDDNFRILFEDCIMCIVLLGREVRPLVEAVCNVEWSSRSADLVELYIRFLLDLVTAHTYHSPLVMTSLVKAFKAEGANWDTEAPMQDVERWSNVHSVIAQIIAVMPMSSTILMQTIIEQFPYYKAGCYINRAYIYNLIWMTKYIPSLLEQILTAIITRMIVMDVNTNEKAKMKSEESYMVMDNTDNEISDTLDYCMLEALQWLRDERSEKVLYTMSSVFEKVVLPTHGIRHVQFLLLYTISMSKDCAENILNNLWVVAAGLHTLGPGAIATRRTAASHLAGLLARCARIPNRIVAEYLKAMADWCHAYITATQESTAASDSVKVHGAFYAICHAVFYLIAFKHQQLFASKESINFVESLNLPRLVTCNLNPLRSCPPQVTRSFASVTRAHQVVYCQAVLEKNARHTLQATTQAEYDEWFPYDPYVLPRSGKIVWPLCIEYKEWLNEGDDDTQYTSRVKKIEGDEDDFLMASPSLRLASSLSNCVSPGFKYM